MPLLFAAVLAAAPARAEDEPPALKPGQWELTIVIDGQTLVETGCTTPETAGAFLPSLWAQGCERKVERRADGSYLVRATCTDLGVTLEHELTMSGDFDREVKAQLVTVAAGQRSVAQYSSRRIGECAAPQPGK